MTTLLGLPKLSGSGSIGFGPALLSLSKVVGFQCSVSSLLRPPLVRNLGIQLSPNVKMRLKFDMDKSSASNVCLRHKARHSLSVMRLSSLQRLLSHVVNSYAKLALYRHKFISNNFMVAKLVNR